MAVWKEEQESFIEKLEKMREIFKEIREKDRRHEVIRYEERNKFDKLAKANEMLLKKLRLREFTVAVVGLEKAGKSTLANALLKVVLLPEYTERCTYTTTEIRAGNEDIAEIYFYSKDKFEENFQRLLKDTGWSCEETFDELDLRKFERYWSLVKTQNPALYQQHNGTTVEDIRKILLDKDTINYLVGKPPEFLRTATQDGCEQLQRYITGISGYEEGHVIRTAEPYAVERVVIKSTGLGDMKNLVLYDVPGFDSPTDLHKKQTESMLQAADAIILVTNVGDRPNLTGTQLDMLKKGHDKDGITLSDKVFVFGNKLDTAGNAQFAEDNRAALIHDAVDKYALAKRTRVICGSAKAYLESIGKLSKDDLARGSRNAGGNLRAWNMSDGIEELKTKMQSYYDTERFDVLIRRAENGIAKAKIFLNEILSKYDGDSVEDFDDGGQYLLQAKDALEEFAKTTTVICRDYRNRISAEMPFSSLLSDDIEKIFPSVTEESQLISEAENVVATDSDNIYALSRVDSLVREKLHMDFKKNIVAKTAGVTHDKEAEIYQKLAEEFLHIMGLEENSPDTQALSEGVKELFKKLLIADGEHCYFNPLVERYSPALIETLIRCPFASVERLQKLTNPVTMPEIQSLAVYYAKPATEDTATEISSATVEEETLDDKQTAFFVRILTHEEFSPPSVSENESTLRKFFQENSDYLTSGFDAGTLPFGTWSALLSKLNVRASEEVLPLLKKALGGFVGLSQWTKMSPRLKNEQINNAIVTFCANKVKRKSLAEKLNLLAKNLYGAGSKSEMLSVLNKDIELLRDITLNAMIRAIGLERAFISVMEKNFAMIRESINDESGKAIFNQWLKENLRKIRTSEFAEVYRQRESLKNKRAIVASIRQVLERIEE